MYMTITITINLKTYIYIYTHIVCIYIYIYMFGPGVPAARLGEALCLFRSSGNVDMRIPNIFGSSLAL